MERCFIVNENSKYIQCLDRYYKDKENQRQFVANFFKEYGIESEKYIVRGDGGMNKPFTELCKNDITLSIIPTKNDIEKFNKQLKKPNNNGVQTFKLHSQISKIFAQECIDKQIIINLYAPQIRDYFKTLELSRCSSSYFKYQGNHYLLVEGDSLKEDDSPEGFEPIKTSDFYKNLEELKGQENQNE